MTVQPVVTETVYALTGTTLGPFNTVWPYNAPSDVNVSLSYAANYGAGQWRSLTQGVDYTLTAYNPSLNNGGYVTLASSVMDPSGSWQAGAQVILYRVTPKSQPSSFGEAVGFSPQASEQALDNVERQVQELGAQVSRSLRVNPGLQVTTGISNEPYTLIGTDVNGNIVQVVYGTQPNTIVGVNAAGALVFIPASEFGVTP